MGSRSWAVPCVQGYPVSAFTYALATFDGRAQRGFRLEAVDRPELRKMPVVPHRSTGTGFTSSPRVSRLRVRSKIGSIILDMRAA